MMTCELRRWASLNSAMDLARRLSLALEQNRLRREMQKLTHPKVVIIDEVGNLTSVSNAVF